MIKALPVVSFCFACLLGVFLMSGCEVQQESTQKTLKVGVIAPLTGPATALGKATVLSAEVVADYYNERGGVEVDGQMLQIELIVKDDSYDPNLSAEIAQELVSEDVFYIIGPVGSACVSSVSNILDGSGVLHVHYGVNQSLLTESSLGILGMSMPELSLPVLYQHLVEEREIEDVLVMSYDTKTSVGLKSTAEYIAEKHELEVMKLSRFDVSEETFDFELTPKILSQRVTGVVNADPDLLLLVGCPPSVFILLVDRLRAGGYEGLIAAQNLQDTHALKRFGEVANDVYLIGGVPEEGRSDYYYELKGLYLDRSDSWGVATETKIYALEFILECVGQAGIEAYKDPTNIYFALEELSFIDPFYEDPRDIMVSNLKGMEERNFRRMQLPIRLSKMQDGELVLVAETFPQAKE